MNQKIKVCGLTHLNQIQQLIDLNIDFLGFIFYPKSPRFVLTHLSLEEISQIDSQSKMGVFVNESVENILEIAEKAQLNFIQLHGDETHTFIYHLREKLSDKIGIIKVVRIGNQTVEELQKTINQQSSIVNFLLFDTDSAAFGGTGKSFDWNILNKLNIPIPYFLSGGISNENANEIENLSQKPFALDINSKFEKNPGNKNLEKIKEFLLTTEHLR
ncbi:phosphoribosylanthranilate isomerase [Chryseobacterium sp.]|uniref:phosphoribosylanthranilate isomerase n=1 Tax=Chryseobacterium sp. TaxID=1871047 RepID=UPI00388FDEA9